MNNRTASVSALFGSADHPAGQITLSARRDVGAKARALAGRGLHEVIPLHPTVSRVAPGLMRSPAPVAV